MSRDSELPTTPGRSFRRFSYRGAGYRISSRRPDIVEDAIVTLRLQLETYIDIHPAFKESLLPVDPIPGAPPIAVDMHAAALAAGVGPLAAVAGAMAEHAVRTALDAGDADVVVENGGDIFLAATGDITVSLYAGDSPLAHSIAFLVRRERMPLAVCSSSGTMGHSMSFGSADLVTVVAQNAALADAAATALCNRVRGVDRIEGVLDEGMKISGVAGVLIVKDDRIGVIGELPEIVKQKDPGADGKITRSKP